MGFNRSGVAGGMESDCTDVSPCAVMCAQCICANMLRVPSAYVPMCYVCPG